MTALAVAYQVQDRLSEVAPVRAKGFDHTTAGRLRPEIVDAVSRLEEIEVDALTRLLSTSRTSQP